MLGPAGGEIKSRLSFAQSDLVIVVVRPVQVGAKKCETEKAGCDDDHSGGNSDHVTLKGHSSTVPSTNF
jgi:hypothetical protein